MPRRLVPLLLTATVVLLAAPVAAEEAEATPDAPPNVVEARDRVRRGEELFGQGNFDAALVEFQQAYDIIGEHPNRHLILYNIGQCHQRSFRYDLALRFYRQYLEEGGEGAEGRARVEETIAELEGLLATVVVEVNVPQAEVWVEDRQVGTAPGRVRIPGGLHTIEARAEGHLAARQEVQVPAGGEVTVSLTLEPLPERFEGLHQAYFWSSTALFVASAVAAAGLGIAALQAHNDVSRRLQDGADRWDVTQGEIDRIGGLALGADALFGVAAVFAVGAVVLGLLTDWGGPAAEGDAGTATLNLGLTASTRQAGLFAVGVF